MCMYVKVGGDHSQCVYHNRRLLKTQCFFLQLVVLYVYMATNQSCSESECCESLAPYWYLQPKFEKAVHTVVTMVT